MQNKAILFAALVLLPYLYSGQGATEVGPGTVPVCISEIAGAIRGTDTWHVLSDNGHESDPPGLEVYVTGDGDLRLMYGQEYKKVITFIVTPDEVYIPMGVSFGANVGLSYTDITFFREGKVTYPSLPQPNRSNLFFYGRFRC